MKRKKILSTALATLLVSSLYSQTLKKGSVLVNLSMPQREIVNSQDLSLTVKITNQNKFIIEVPIQDEWGYILHHSGFLAIQVQRKSKSGFIDIPTRARLDSYSGVDIDTLRTNERKDWSYNISRTYDFSKGSYRIKILARLSALNSIADVSSKWYYFSCIQDIKL